MRIDWKCERNVPAENQARNIAACAGFKKVGAHTRPVLAVVAGGPSVSEHIEELRQWPGDLWIVGSAFPWALANGIEGTFFNIDQHPSVAKDCVGAKKAILATCTDPSVFAALNGEVEVFDVENNHYATSLTATPFLAPMMGYTEIHFYGCESSYRDTTHAYRHEYWEGRGSDTIRVVCNGGAFLTNPSFLMQAEFMAEVVRLAPQLFHIHCDGLLAAMVQNSDYDITHGSAERAALINDQLRAA
jgi:hypothetical protein